MLITAQVLRMKMPYGRKRSGAASRNAATANAPIQASGCRGLMRLPRPHAEERSRSERVSKHTDLGPARDRHFEMRKSGKPDLRGGPMWRGLRLWPPISGLPEIGIFGCASRAGPTCDVRDASLRDAPHHEGSRGSYRPLLDAAEQALRTKQDHQDEDQERKRKPVLRRDVRGGEIVDHAEQQAADDRTAHLVEAADDRGDEGVEPAP